MAECSSTKRHGDAAAAAAAAPGMTFDTAPLHIRELRRKRGSEEFVRCLVVTGAIGTDVEHYLDDAGMCFKELLEEYDLRVLSLGIPDPELRWSLSAIVECSAGTEPLLRNAALSHRFDGEIVIAGLVVAEAIDRDWNSASDRDLVQRVALRERLPWYVEFNEISAAHGLCDLLYGSQTPSSPPRSGYAFTAAGLRLFAKKADGSVTFLVPLMKPKTQWDKSRSRRIAKGPPKLSDGFGGNVSTASDANLIETAVREFAEETYGACRVSIVSEWRERLLRVHNAFFSKSTSREEFEHVRMNVGFVNPLAFVGSSVKSGFLGYSLFVSEEDVPIAELNRRLRSNASRASCEVISAEWREWNPGREANRWWLYNSWESTFVPERVRYHERMLYP